MTIKTTDNQPEIKATGHITAGLPTLTRQEREVLTQHLQKDHIGAVPHAHVDTEITSPGEKAFNLITYKGIGFVANAALSVYLTDLFKNGSGKPVFEKWAKDLSPSFAKFRGLEPAQAEQAAKGLLITTGLFSGGTILLYPIKKLEEYKPQIVTWLDDKYNTFHAATTSDLAVQQAAHERLASDAKPSWKNVLLGRLLGTSTVLAASIGLAGRDKIGSELITDKTAEAMTESGNKLFNRLGASERFKNIMSLSLIEAYQSFIAEEVLYLTTRMYKTMKRKELIAASNDNLATAPIISQPVESLTHEPEEMAQTSSFADRVTRNAIASDRALDQPPVESYTDKVIEMRQSANQPSRGSAA